MVRDRVVVRSTCSTRGGVGDDGAISDDGRFVVWGAVVPASGAAARRTSGSTSRSGTGRRRRPSRSWERTASTSPSVLVAGTSPTGATASTVTRRPGECSSAHGDPDRVTRAVPPGLGWVGLKRAGDRFPSDAVACSLPSASGPSTVYRSCGHALAALDVPGTSRPPAARRLAGRRSVRGPPQHLVGARRPRPDGGDGRCPRSEGHRTGGRVDRGAGAARRRGEAVPGAACRRRSRRSGSSSRRLRSSS